jgi:hypothetical protein
MMTMLLTGHGPRGAEASALWAPAAVEELKSVAVTALACAHPHDRSTVDQQVHWPRRPGVGRRSQCGRYSLKRTVK